MTMNEPYTLDVKRRGFGDALLYFAAALCLLLLAVTIINSVFSLCLVDGSSMWPTLRDGQYVTLYNSFTPECGDIVVFDCEEGTLIKRVVATEGQTVELRYAGDNVLELYVDGERAEEDYLGEPMTDAYVRHSGVFLRPDEIVTVPEGCLFVLGDNRNDSTDSRFASVGFVPTGSVRGKVAAIVPPGNITEFFVRLFMGGL